MARNLEREGLPPTAPGEAKEGLLRLSLSWVLGALFGVLTLLGVAGLLMRLQDGFRERLPWGYYAAAFAFLLTTFQAAPLVSVGLRLAKAHWRRPLARGVELCAVAGLLNALVFIPLVLLMPSVEGRNSLWFEWPLGAPRLWDSLAVAFLALSGLALLYFASLPDLATLRDRATGWRRRTFSSLAFHWQGSHRQWKALHRGLNLLGPFYLVMFVLVNTLVSTDLAMSLVPGWRSAIFPAYHALTGLQGGLAAALVLMGMMRWAGGARAYISLDIFWNLGKILLALCLLWFYFWWADFLTFWYGRLPNEENILQLLMFGPYRIAFILSFVFNFLAPFFVLLWNPVRRSIPGPILAAGLVLVGNLIDKVRVYVPAFSFEEAGHSLTPLPAAHLPETADLLIIVGAIGGSLLLYLLATKLVPFISAWEVEEGLRLEASQPFLKKATKVVAKPE